MLNQRLSVTRTVTEGLAELEKQIDAAFVRLARLQIDAIDGRRTAHLPLDAGQEALDKLAAATSTLMAARAQVHAAHYAFRETRQQLRLPVVSYGDTGDTPDSVAPKGSDNSISPTLEIVRAA